MNEFMKQPQHIGQTPGTIEEMKGEAAKHEKYEEEVLSPGALAARELIKMGGREKLKNITPKDVDEAFEKIKLSPIDYLNSDIVQIKELIGKTDISKTDSVKIKGLLKMSWTSLSNAIQLPGTNKQDLVNYAIYLDSVELYVKEHKL
ncbi:MAG: hypothetical protein PHC97_02160 [Patescibacteria group bacterium]|nr:hypothetical protein [Patescibacteria group bacterium]